MSIPGKIMVTYFPHMLKSLVGWKTVILSGLALLGDGFSALPQTRMSLKERYYCLMRGQTQVTQVPKNV